MTPARIAAGGAVCGPLLLMLGACGGDPSAIHNGSEDRRVEIIDSGQGIATSRDLPGTPMARRVAVLGLLNKRNGLTRDITMRPGQALRVGSAVIRLRACERTAPWESPPSTGAFVQLDVRGAADGKWRRAFSGWLFKERPDYNVVQHPIYDVWVKSCTMEWPETGESTLRIGEDGAPASSRSSAAKSPAATSGEPGIAPETASSNSTE